MLALTAITAALFSQTRAAKWDYDDDDANTNHWSDLYAECGYKRQSPIDVPIDLTSTCGTPLEIKWTSQYSHYAVMNNGHSLQAIPFEINHNGGSDISGLEVLSHRNDTSIRLTNAFYGTYESSINKEYCFNSLHFHWGKTDDDGSEHTINGKAYPLELHLVHYSCDYHDAGEALKDYASGQAASKYDDDNVLAVIGIMFEIGEANPLLNKILDYEILDGIYKHKDTHSQYNGLIEMYYTEFDLKELLPESRECVAYLGSLTTPPCYETVRWHVMKEPMTVSEEQMARFRVLLESTNVNDTMAPNFRPIQPTNGRKVWQCQEDADEDMLGTKTEANVVVLQEEENEAWQHVAIGFIALFTFTFLTCALVVCYFCKTYQRVTTIRKSPPPPPNAVQMQMQMDDGSDIEETQENF